MSDATCSDLALFYLLREGATFSAEDLAVATGRSEVLFKAVLLDHYRTGIVARHTKRFIRNGQSSSFEFHLTNGGVRLAVETLSRRNPGLYMLLIEHSDWDHGTHDELGPDTIGFQCIDRDRRASG